MNLRFPGGGFGRVFSISSSSSLTTGLWASWLFSPLLDFPLFKIVSVPVLPPAVPIRPLTASSPSFSSIRGCLSCFGSSMILAGLASSFFLILDRTFCAKISFEEEFLPRWGGVLPTADYVSSFLNPDIPFPKWEVFVPYRAMLGIIPAAVVYLFKLIFSTFLELIFKGPV